MRPLVVLVLIFGGWLGGGLVVLVVAALMTGTQLMWLWLGLTVVLAVLVGTGFVYERRNHARPQVMPQAKFWWQS